MKSKGKLKKNPVRIKLPRVETCSATGDLSQLRKPVDINVTSLKHVAQLLDKGSEEVCSLLTYECDIIYECRVCRSLFRSLANFISHKRVYCIEKHNVSHNRHTMDPAEEIFDKDAFAPSDGNFDDPYTENCANDRVTRSQSVKKVPKKDLTSVVNMLTMGQRDDTEEEIAMKETENCDSSQTDSNNDQVLREVQESNKAAYQTDVCSNIASSVDADSMKTQTIELKTVANQNTAVLGPDGKLVGDNDVPKKDVESSVEDKVAKTQNSTSSDVLNCTMCTAKFCTRKSLAFHMKFKHMMLRMCYTCPCCTGLFTDRWSVYRHLFKVHRKTNDQVRRIRSQIQVRTFKRDSSRLENKPTKEIEPVKPVAETEVRTNVETPNIIMARKWMEKLELNAEFHRCDRCGRRFERKAALASHSLICLKRIRHESGRKTSKRARKNAPQKATENVETTDESTINGKISKSENSPSNAEKISTNPQSMKTSVSPKSQQSIVTTETPLSTSKSEQSLASSKIEQSSSLCKIEQSSMPTKSSSLSLIPLKSLTSSVSLKTVPIIKSPESMISSVSTKSEQSPLPSSMNAQSLPSPLSSRSVLKSSAAKSLSQSAISRSTASTTESRSILRPIRPKPELMPITKLCVIPSITLSSAQGSSSTRTIQRSATPMPSAQTLIAKTKRSPLSPNKLLETSIRVEGVSSLSKDVWDKIGTNDNRSVERRDSSEMSSDVPTNLSQSDKITSVKSPKDASSSIVPGNSDVPEVIYTSIDNSRPLTLSVLNTEQKLGIQYRGIRLPTVTLEKINVPRVRDDAINDETNYPRCTSGQSTSMAIDDEVQPTQFRKLYCLPCNRRFMSLANLRRHIAVHLRRNRYRCGLCDFKSLLKCDCVAHCNKIHNAKNNRALLAEWVVEVPISGEFDKTNIRTMWTREESNESEIIDDSQLPNDERLSNVETLVETEMLIPPVEETTCNEILSAEPVKTTTTTTMVTIVNPKKSRPIKRKGRRGRKRRRLTTRPKVKSHVSPPRLTDDSADEMFDIGKLFDDEMHPNTIESLRNRAPSRLDQDPELRKMVMEVIFGPSGNNASDESTNERDNETDGNTKRIDEVLEQSDDTLSSKMIVDDQAHKDHEIKGVMENSSSHEQCESIESSNVPINHDIVVLPKISIHTIDEKTSSLPQLFQHTINHGSALNSSSIGNRSIILVNEQSVNDVNMVKTAMPEILFCGDK